MEFIARSPEPKFLSTNKEKWTKSWVDYYRKNRDQDDQLIRDKKPSDSHWTKNEIRLKLISDFKNNCGYCGCSRPTPRAAKDNWRASRGHVDHYRAKAIHPELTYEWSNFIWSCEACNVEKGEFDDPSDPILNPCQLEDCKQLKFIIDTGAYNLLNQDGLYHARFANTDKLTMLNANEIIVRRRNRVKGLRSLFSSIYTMLKIDSSALVKVINDNIISIKLDLEDPEFNFLIHKEHQKLRTQYPEVAGLIDSTEA